MSTACMAVTVLLLGFTAGMLYAERVIGVKVRRSSGNVAFVSVAAFIAAASVARYFATNWGMLP